MLLRSPLVSRVALTSGAALQQARRCVGSIGGTPSSSSTPKVAGVAATATKPAFDAAAFAREQERRRASEARKAFWGNSARPASAASDAGSATSAAASEAADTGVPLWGRDSVELVERVRATEREGMDKHRSGVGARSAAASPQSAPARDASAGAATASASAHASAGSESAAASAAPSTARSRIQALHSAYATRDGTAGSKDEAAADSERAARRRAQLTFREVDYDLDRVRLGRDLLQWVTYARRGKDYAVDCELERELRYFPEQVAHELKVNAKFLVGAQRLPKSGPAFPTLSNLTRLSSLAAANSAGAGAGAARGFDSDTLSASAFTVPTLVIVSQLAHTSTGVEDIDRYYVPLLAQALATPLAGAAASAGRSPEVKAATPRDVVSLIGEISGAADGGTKRRADVAFVKTIDFQSAIWTRRWLMRVMARRMDPAVASRFYCGVRALRGFAPLGLRNYGAQYVLLVDHVGRVRWLSTGAPTEGEAAWFCDHVRALLKAHVVANATSPGAPK
jgi:hypothetical protein